MMEMMFKGELDRDKLIKWLDGFLTRILTGSCLHSQKGCPLNLDTSALSCQLLLEFG